MTLGFRIILFVLIIEAYVGCLSAGELKNVDTSVKQEKFIIQEKGLPNSLITIRPGEGESVSTLIDDIPSSTAYMQKIMEQEKGKWRKLTSGGYYKEIYKGKGKEIKSGWGAFTHFKLYLDNGTELENTFKKRLMYTFVPGNGEVKPFFEECVVDMREGSKRKIMIPAPFISFGVEAPYQTQSIPPGATLIFEITLCWVREPEWEKVNLFK